MITKEFEAALHLMVMGDKNITSKPLTIGSPSEILVKCGAKKDDLITITKKVIDKSMRQEIRDVNGRMIGNTGHGLTEQMIVASIKELEEPLMIFKGKQNNSLLILTEVIDQKERNIVIAIELERLEGFSKVISVRSIYGRDNINNYICMNIDDNNLLAANKEKADELLRSIGKSYPKENTFISY